VYILCYLDPSPPSKVRRSRLATAELRSEETRQTRSLRLPLTTNNFAPVAFSFLSRRVPSPQIICHRFAFILLTTEPRCHLHLVYPIEPIKARFPSARPANRQSGPAVRSESTFWHVYMLSCRRQGTRLSAKQAAAAIRPGPASAGSPTGDGDDSTEVSWPFDAYNPFLRGRRHRPNCAILASTITYPEVHTSSRAGNDSHDAPATTPFGTARDSVQQMDRGGATDRSGYELSTCRAVVCGRVCPIRPRCYFFSLVSARQILYHERCIPVAVFAGY